MHMITTVSLRRHRVVSRAHWSQLPWQLATGQLSRQHDMHMLWHTGGCMNLSRGHCNATSKSQGILCPTAISGNAKQLSSGDSNSEVLNTQNCWNHHLALPGKQYPVSNLEARLNQLTVTNDTL